MNNQSFFGIKLSQNPIAEDLSKADLQLKVLDFLCPKPSPFDLVRIGGATDGAYIIPECISRVDACFSPGVANRKDFEDEIYQLHGITSHMCDYSSDLEYLQSSLLPGQTFKKLWLDVSGSNSITLDSWVADYCPNSNSLMLQMDIEGAEYRNILSVSDECLSRFLICVIELHGLSGIENDLVLRSVLGPFFARLDKFFTCVHAHPNNCSGVFYSPLLGELIPHVLEVTLLSKQMLANQDQGLFRPPILPHPLDVVNVSHQPPIFLEGRWRKYCQDDYSKLLQSRLLSLEKTLEYYSDPRNFCQTLQANKAVDWTARWSVNPLSLSGSLLTDATSLGKNIAAGKSYVCSSVFFESSTETGLVPLSADAPYFFHTKILPCQSISIDLGAAFNISGVEIVNRFDSCMERASMLFLSFSEHQPDPEDLPDPAESFLIDFPDEFLLKRMASFYVHTIDRFARYITIFSPKVTALHFAKIAVYA